MSARVCTGFAQPVGFQFTVANRTAKKPKQVAVPALHVFQRLAFSLDSWDELLKAFSFFFSVCCDDFLLIFLSTESETFCIHNSLFVADDIRSSSSQQKKIRIIANSGTYLLVLKKKKR